MDFLVALRDFGWLGVLVLFVVREVWPKAFSSYQKQIDTKLDTMKQQRQDEITAATAEREMRVEERKFRHENDLRQVIAYEKLAEAQGTQTQLLAKMTEQLATVSLALSALNTFMVNYTSDMRETVGTMAGQIAINTSDLRALKGEFDKQKGHNPDERTRS